ncbi:MAG: hypothetical protein J0H91_21925, partial [Rhodospirillales bacterium]|nr:hypothetical protein [Rhodospirillales bacterium]
MPGTAAPSGGETAGGVDLLDFQHHRVTRRGAELRDTSGQNGRHADLDRFGLCSRHPWRSHGESTGTHQRKRRPPVDSRLSSLCHLALLNGYASSFGDHSVSVPRRI